MRPPLESFSTASVMESRQSFDSFQNRGDSYFDESSVVFGDVDIRNRLEELEQTEQVAVAPEAPIDLVHRLKAERMANRAIHGVTVRERSLSKLEQPVPVHYEVMTFENLLCHLYHNVEQVETIVCMNGAARARAAVFLSHISLQTANVLHNAVTLHEDILEKVDTPKQRRRLRTTRMWRKNGSFVQVKLRTFLGKYPRVGHAEKVSLFERLGHKTIDDGEHPLSVMNCLKTLFYDLTLRISQVANDSYNTVQEQTLILESKLDNEFVWVGKKELNAHLCIIDDCLVKSAAIIKELKNEDFNNLYPDDGLDQLDRDNLSFILPYVLPSVRLLNGEEDIQEFLRKVESTMIL